MDAAPVDVLIVEPSHPLHMSYVMRDPVCVGNFKFSSVESCFWACYCAQHRLFDDARYVASKPDFCDHPFKIRSYVNDVMSERGMEIEPGWLMNLEFILSRIFAAFLEFDCPNNAFLSFARSLGMPQPQSEFLIVSSHPDTILTCGKDKRQMRGCLQMSRSDLQCLRGMNVYGYALKATLVSWNGGGLASVVHTTLIDLLTRVVVVPTTYVRTVALISDSMLRHVDSIQAGHVYPKGGATCDILAGLLQKMHVHLSFYKIVVLWVGTNDSTRHPSQWPGLWEPLRVILRTLVDDPHVKVVLNTGIGVLGWPYVPSYSDWFIHEVRHLTGPNCRNFYVFDWSRPGPRNPFIEPNGHAAAHYFDDDKKHLNPNGIRRARREWANVVPELAYVELTLSESLYPNGQFGTSE